MCGVDRSCDEVVVSNEIASPAAATEDAPPEPGPDGAPPATAAVPGVAWPVLASSNDDVALARVL